MVSQRLRSISSVLGGKNSKEIAGRFRYPSCPSVWAGIVASVMGTTHSKGSPGRWRPAVRSRLGEAKIGQKGRTRQPIRGGKLPTFCVQIKKHPWLAVEVGKLTSDETYILSDT